ncbi:hypothetical protein [Aggregatimonas sangjinii]|uniref:hypothetical protein n=1 Tax=Aggregatimonas sangjinii TaxID=2583587 RepID=UPI0015869FFC|nr:hypothetical protein [Aggregatimonas sangjinii]
MERTRSKAKVAKAEENWKRLQELRKKEEEIRKASKLKKVSEKDSNPEDSSPLKEIA